MSVSEFHPKRTQVKAHFPSRDKHIHFFIENGMLTWKVDTGETYTLASVDTLHLANFLHEHYQSIVLASRATI